MKLRTRWLGIATALMVTGLVQPASAQDGKLVTHFGMFADGLDDDDKDENNTTNDGSKVEQIRTSHLMIDGNLHVFHVYMDSNTGGTGNYQCWLVDVMVKKDGSGPEIASKTQLTNYANGDRQCNRPHIMAFYLAGTPYVGISYGTDNYNGNPEVYFDIFSTTGQKMYNGPNNDKIRLSNDANNNEGASTMFALGNLRDFTTNLESEGYFTLAYGSTNNNDRTMQVTSRIYMDENNELAVEIMNREQILAPTNQPRPSIVVMPDGMHTLHCNAIGNNRPPEDGADCAYVNAMTGERIWRKEFHDSENGAYFNQVTAVHLFDNIVAIHGLVSDGTGKDNGGKGATTAITETYRITDTGMTRTGKFTGAGAYQSHSSICAGKYGESGEYGIAVIDAPIIAGAGQPILDIIEVKTAEFLDFNQTMGRWAVSTYNGDSGDYQNYYGGNPNIQGRGFPFCQNVTVPNPGYGLDIGFMPHVKSFWVVPHVAARNPEEKLAGFYGFVPAEVDFATEPGDPTEEVVIEERPESNPANKPPTEQPNPEDVLNPKGPGFNNATAGGCSASTGDTDNTGLVFLMLGLGFIGLARRREEV